MKRYLLLAALVLIGIAPFSSRAVFMDEHIFLQLGRAAAANWAFPQDTPGMFFGTPIANFAAHTHPPVGEYYLALLYHLFGDFREIPFHLLFGIFAIAAVLAFYSLAMRFTAQPFWVALLFAVSPAFYLYSSTLMMDVPMLAFLLVGFALYFAHVQGRPALLPLASICFVLAVGTGYTALVPLGCFAVALLAARRPLKELLSVAAAPLALSVWLAAMTIHFGEFPLVRTVQFFASQGSVSRNVMATLSFLGSVAVFPWLIGAKRIVAVISIGIAAALTLLIPWPSLGYRLWFIVLASAGLAMLAAFARSARKLVALAKNNGEGFLILWLPATLLFFITVGDMINARYIMLALPAFFLVCLRETAARRLVLMVIPTTLLSVTIAYSDYIFVNANREWVQQNVGRLEGQGYRLWGAAESGLRFYIEQNGIVSLRATDTAPKPADLIIRHVGSFRYSLSESLEPKLTILKTFTLTSHFPVRTFSGAAGAGFHDSRFGLVPYTLSREPFDVIEVAQVSPLPEAVWSPRGTMFTQTQPEREFPLKLPSNSKIEYELDGDGVVAATAENIRLIKGASPAIVWRNFRIVPKQFLAQ
jgi:hypothetical protein